MRFCVAVFCLSLLCGIVQAQEPGKRPAEPDSVTVPAAIDHNRVVIIADSRCPTVQPSAFAHGWITVIQILIYRAAWRRC